MADWHGVGGEWSAWVAAKTASIVSGVAGAYVRNLFPPYKPWSQRIPEYVGGALTAVYGGPVVGPLMFNALVGLFAWTGIPVGDALPRTNVESLAGFLCGVVGLTVIEGLFIVARKWRDNPKLPLS